MSQSYLDFSQTMITYCMFPSVALYLCLVLQGLYAQSILESGVKALLAAKRHIFTSSAVVVSLIFLLPMVVVFGVLRGSEVSGLTVVGGLSGTTLKSANLIFMIFVLNLSTLFLRKVRHSNPHSVELTYTYVFIFLAWFFILLCRNLLTFLLALEIVTLLLFIILCNVSLSFNIGFTDCQRNWTSIGGREQTQYSVISVLLSFVWVMGFATIFFLWAIALMFPLLNSTDFSYVSLVSLNWASVERTGFCRYILVSGNWLGLALLFKLLLQPFQTFLLVFYKQLPPALLFNYFQFYYIFVLIFIFFYVVLPFGVVTLSWHFGLLSYVTSLLVLLLLSTETLRDLSAVLAYSTFANISFFLIVSGYHSC